ncbi:MAG: SIS domain-containing protein [Nitrosopumilaceae archaeon]
MSKFTREIKQLFDKSADTIIKSKNVVNEINRALVIMMNCLENDKKIVLFGNGGSASDAQHMAAELVGRYLHNRRSLPAIALTTDSSILTAIGNDYGFDQIFARQCESLVERGDVVIAISTSGRSINVIKGIKMAKKKGGTIIALTGNKGGQIKKLADVSIIIPSQETPRIQEAHRTVIHILCELTEKKFSK